MVMRTSEFDFGDVEKWMLVIKERMNYFAHVKTPLLHFKAFLDTENQNAEHQFFIFYRLNY